MSNSKCDLYLDNYTDHYSGGQTIVGYALCTFVSPKEVHGILLKIKGEATTHWTESESHYNHTTKRNESRSVSYHGCHLLVSEEIDLLHNGGRETTIQQGVHKYPFAYTLPQNLPSSFHHNLGKIEYTIKVVVKRPLLRFNYEAELPFLIVTPVDLNNYSAFQDPQTRTKLKKTYFCCWNNGTINVTANIPKSGFIIGEPLPLHIQVENLSQTTIERIKCKVRKTQTFTVTSPRRETREDTDIIFSDCDSGVGAHGENSYDKAILIDNASLVSNCIDNDVISISYELAILFELSRFHTYIKLKIPVQIGHIPFGIAPPIAPAPGYNIGFDVPTAAVQPPSYGFVQPQPAYNPSVMPPPYSDGTNGAVGGYPLASASAPMAPMAPTAPTLEATAPSKDGKNSDDWDFVDDSGSQELPSYDQAMRNQMKI